MEGPRAVPFTCMQVIHQFIEGFNALPAASPDQPATLELVNQTAFDQGVVYQL